MLSTLCPLYVSRSVMLSMSTQFPSVHFIMIIISCLTHVPHYIQVYMLLAPKWVLRGYLS